MSQPGPPRKLEGGRPRDARSAQLCARPPSFGADARAASQRGDVEIDGTPEGGVARLCASSPPRSAPTTTHLLDAARLGARAQHSVGVAAPLEDERLPRLECGENLRRRLEKTVAPLVGLKRRRDTEDAAPVGLGALLDERVLALQGAR